jgi:hypothetical protein
MSWLFRFLLWSLLWVPVDKALALSVEKTTFLPSDGIAVGDSAAESVVDLTKGFAYVAAGHKIFKLSLTDKTTIQTLTLQSEETKITCGAIDPSGGFAYFGLQRSPARIVRIRLSDFAEAGTLTLPSTIGPLDTASLDSAAGNAYFASATGTTPLAQVRLSDFTVVKVISLAGHRIASSAIDAGAGFLYLGAWDGGAPVLKVRLADLSIAGSIALTPDKTGAQPLDRSRARKTLRRDPGSKRPSQPHREHRLGVVFDR